MVVRRKEQLQPASVPQYERHSRKKQAEPNFMQRQVANSKSFFILPFFRLEPEKQIKNRILIPKLQQASVLNSKSFPLVSFWIKKFTGCQFFELKDFRVVRFWNIFFRNETFKLKFFSKKRIWVSAFLKKKTDLEGKIWGQKIRFRIGVFPSKSYLDLKKIVIFWISNFSSCRVLKKSFHKVLDCHLKIFHLVSFW